MSDFRALSDRFRSGDPGLDGLTLVERLPREDSRGWLERLFCAETFRSIGFGTSVSQINRTHTKQRGTLRGMHFQYPPSAEIKFVSCLHGEVFDVALDLRTGSPTFLHWHGEILSEKNRRSLLIPHGFAHGFQTLTDDCEMLYLHSAPYEKACEGGVHPLDPACSISWPLPVSELSDRDSQHPFIGSAFKGVDLS